MKTFAVDTDNAITVFATSSEAQRAAAGAERFSSDDELAKVASEWPSSRLVAVWNGIPGVVPVRKFTDRKTGVRRVWEAVQQLEVPAAAEPKQKRSPGVKRAKRADSAAENGATKKDIVLGLLKRTDGATLEDLMTATGWQAHSVRGFISGMLVKKLSIKVESEKREGKRVYSVAG